MDVLYITKHNATDIHPAFTSYYTSYNISPITIGNSTYTGLEMLINIPNDREQYKASVLEIYLHP
jgi:hypothetical protein